jgi:FAD/FMN-containing dehydrogenase
MPIDLAGLREIVGGQHLLTDDDQRIGYETDWTRRFVGRCDAVVRPADADEVARVVTWCASSGVAVVPQGGNTGLVGGSVPAAVGEAPVIVLSTRRLDEIEALDPAAGQITVGAGVTLADLGDAVIGSGWEVGVDLGARESATIGGMVATNAGGTRVVRHGMMRRNLVGVEAVLADGSIVRHLSGLEKDNTGYDLAGLLCGSEGTLAVITRVRLRLVPALPDRVVALVACDGWDDAVDLARTCRMTVPGIEALEAVDRVTAELVASVTGVAAGVTPVSSEGVLVLVMWAGTGEPGAELTDAIADRPHAVAVDRPAQDRLWVVRDRATECIATTGVPHKLDVTLPLGELPQFVSEATAHLAARDDVDRVHVFGHVGDGNLHVNVIGPGADDDSVDAEVLQLVADHGGSISAEHGIGRLKLPYLHLSRSETERRAFAAIKHALDPRGILNPGVLVRTTGLATPAPL